MDEGRLTKVAYKVELRNMENGSWATVTKKLLGKLGLGEYWNNQRVVENKEEWGRIVRERIQEREQKDWRERMNNCTQLDTYVVLNKKELKLEEYLTLEDEKGRRIMTRLRSGTNELRIDTGRREGEERKDRVCYFGCKVTEDERHFIVECDMYEDLREDSIREIGAERYKRK